MVPAAGGWNYYLLEKLFQAIPHSGTADTLFDFLVADSLVSSWVFAAAFYWFWSQDDSQTGQRRGRLLQIVAAFAIALLVSLLVRPWINWPAPGLNADFQPLYPQYFWNNGSPDSFPSHSTLAYFAVSAGLWPLSRRVSLILSALVLLLISLPRIYVAGHYPIDVLGALAIVAVILPMVWRWRVPEGATNWLARKGPGAAAREVLLIFWVFELGDGFKGSTYLVATIRHYLLS